MKSRVLVIFALCASGVQGSSPLRGARVQDGAIAPAALVDVSEKATEVPVVEHDKKAGAGYKKGSPFYEKQEQMKKVKGSSGDSGDDKLLPLIKDIGKEDNWLNELGDCKPISSVQSGADFGEYIKCHFTGQFNNPTGMIIYYISELVFIVIVGFLYQLYKSKKVMTADFASNEPDFHYGFCDFGCNKHMDHDDMEFLLCSWCCFPARWADTVSSVKLGKVLGFWPAYLLMAISLLLMQITAGLTGILVLAMALFFRHRNRTVYGLREHEGMSYLCDLGAWCCCWCCATFQEARQVDKVKPRFDMGGKK